MTTEEQVLDIIAEQLAVPRENLSRETRFFEDLDADSLDLSELTMEIEEATKVFDLPEHYQTVGEVVDAVLGKAGLAGSVKHKPYARVLSPDTDGTYAAELLEFPGCFSQGNSPQEAMDNLDAAADAWVAAAREQGQNIPEPLTSCKSPEIVKVRLPAWVSRKATYFAKKDGVSLNQFLMSAISARVGACEQKECCQANRPHPLASPRLPRTE